MPDVLDPLAPLDSSEAGRIVHACHDPEGDVLDVVLAILGERRERDREFGPKVTCVKCHRTLPRRDTLPQGKNACFGLSVCPVCHYTCKDVEEVRISFDVNAPDTLKRVQQIANRWLDESRRMHSALVRIAANKELPLIVRAEALCAASPLYGGNDPKRVTAEMIDEATKPRTLHLN